MTLEILVMFIILGENPFVLSSDLARRGKNPAAIKNGAVELVLNVEAHASGSDFPHVVRNLLDGLELISSLLSALSHRFTRSKG